MSEMTLDPERQEQAKEYARIRRRLMLVDLALGGLYAIIWLLSGWSVDLRDYLLQWTDNVWLLVAGFVLIFGGIYFLIDLPLGYYSGFVLPHRYGLSTQNLRGWVVDLVKGVLLGGALGLLVIEIIYYVLRVSPDLWWLWAGLILLIFTVLLANLAPVLLMPLFYKFVPLEEEHADLVDRLMKLAERAGTHVRGVYQFDMSRRTKAANAAIAGLGNTRRIILGDTLINEFSADEVETILAHELGHQVHRDIPIGILVESVITLGGLYLASLGLGWGVEVFGFEGVSDIAAFPLFGLVLGAYGLVTMPLGNAFSRWRERRADEYALRTTGNGGAYASALTRLANQNLAEVDPEPWVEILLYSHPALNKRIAMAENFH
ncbi:MAG: M48 family metallopeptidase [Anaerolineales bacterium]|nr:M48 family metallopeptidase [Anaerolineales bacterium]